jgi:hypothetical protein
VTGHKARQRGARTVVGAPLGKRGDVVLQKSGVPFRTIVYEDGTIERWQQPELPEWEVPKRDPHERRPRAPEWEPQAAAEIAELAEASDNATVSERSSTKFLHRYVAEQAMERELCRFMAMNRLGSNAIIVS